MRRAAVWARGPMGAGLALALLVGMVSLGMRHPGLGWLFPFGGSAGLDYSAPPFGSFSPLRATFVDSILGPGSNALPARAASSPSDAVGARSRDGDSSPRVFDHPPTNNNMEDAYPIRSVPFSGRTDSQDATRETAEPSDCEALGDTIWYRFTAPADMALNANTYGTNVATSVGVFRGTVRSMAFVECDRDLRGNTAIPFDAIGGTTYFFQIGFPASKGAVTFTLEPAGVTELVSRDWSQPDGGARGDRQSDNSSISADGRYVAFDSYASNIMDGVDDTPCHRRGPYDSVSQIVVELLQSDRGGPCHQTYVLDRSTHTVELVSKSSSDLQGRAEDGNSDSLYSMISGNGRYVAFQSMANNLVPNDRNDVGDIFVHDRLTHHTELISVPHDGKMERVVGDHSLVGTLMPAISHDGRFVAFLSQQSNNVEGDTNRMVDVFVRDRLMGTTERVSVSPAGKEGALDPHHIPAGAAEAPPTLSTDDEVYNRALNNWEPVWARPSISDDGRYVVFASEAANLVSGDTNGVPDIFLRDRRERTTVRVSVPDRLARSGATQANRSSGVRVVGASSVSNDGRYVVFDSFADNLVDDDGNDTSDVFLRDTVLGRTTMLSVAPDGRTPGNGVSYDPVFSPNGRYAAFYSLASNVVVGDDNGVGDVFVRNLHTGRTIRIAVPGAQSTLQGGTSDVPQPLSSASMSADGRVLTFWSWFHSDSHMSGMGVALIGESQVYVHTLVTPP